MSLSSPPPKKKKLSTPHKILKEEEENIFTSLSVIIEGSFVASFVKNF
jgi:hypothetical protein